SKRIWLMPAPSSAAAASASLCASPANSTARRKLRSPIRTRYGWRRAKRRRSFSYQTARRTAMTQIQDPTFYRTPADAIAASLERRYLIVPGLRSSRTYVLDTKPDPRSPRVVHTIEADELATKAGYSRPHTLHCGPDAIFMSALGGANGNDGPAGIALLDHD